MLIFHSFSSNANVVSLPPKAPNGTLRIKFAHFSCHQLCHQSLLGRFLTELKQKQQWRKIASIMQCQCMQMCIMRDWNFPWNCGECQSKWNKNVWALYRTIAHHSARTMKDEKNAIETSIEFIDWLITWWEKEKKRELSWVTWYSCECCNGWAPYLTHCIEFNRNSNEY